MTSSLAFEEGQCTMKRAKIQSCILWRLHRDHATISSTQGSKATTSDGSLFGCSAGVVQAMCLAQQVLETKEACGLFVGNRMAECWLRPRATTFVWVAASRATRKGWGQVVAPAAMCRRGSMMVTTMSAKCSRPPTVMHDTCYFDYTESQSNNIIIFVLTTNNWWKW
jgi:hypothetical protein